MPQLSQHERHELSVLARKDRPESESPSEKEESGVLKILSANATLAAWLVFLGFGGAFLVFYYSHIYYFPELEWKSSFTYLAVMSIFGGGVVGLYGLLLYFPGVIWSEFLIFDSDLKRKLCYGEDWGESEPCFWKTAIYLGLPFAAFMIVVHLALLWKDRPVLWLSVTGLGLIGLTMWSHWSSGRLLDDLDKNDDDRRSLCTKYVVGTDVAALLSATSLLALAALVAADRWSLLFICTLIVVLSNFLVAVQFRHKPVRAALVGIVAALVLLCYGEYLGRNPGHNPLSVSIMQHFGLGGEKNLVTLILTDKGREILQISSEQPQPTPKVIHKAQILSRLGSEYFVVDAQGRRFALPKDAVDSWFFETRQPNPSAVSRAAAPGR